MIRRTLLAAALLAPLTALAQTVPPSPPTVVPVQESTPKPATQKVAIETSLGRIVAAHGVQGWVGIETYTGQPEEVAAYGTLSDERGTRAFEIADMRMGPKGILVRIDGVNDRNQAARQELS